MTTREATVRDRAASNDALRAMIAAVLADSRNAWNLGTFGAVAEFQRDPDEPMVTHTDLRAVNAWRAALPAELPDR